MHKIKFVAVTQLTTLVGLHVSDETKMAINCNFQVTGKVTEGSHLIFWRLSRISCPLSSAVLSGTRQTNLLRHKHGSRSMSQGASYYSRRLNQLVSSGSPEQANSGEARTVNESLIQSTCCASCHQSRQRCGETVGTRCDSPSEAVSGLQCPTRSVFILPTLSSACLLCSYCKHTVLVQLHDASQQFGVVVYAFSALTLSVVWASSTATCT